MFRGIAGRRSRRIASLCKKESYEADQVVFREGDIADHFYLVLSGEIAITIGETEVARMELGQIFGEMALLEHIPRTAPPSGRWRFSTFPPKLSIPRFRTWP
ncbi:MAG TPA: hypothetical protein DDZ83_11725 [Nitrospinae bacterium]|nr:hypothetical protein [Nitrospinota bacterium]